MKRNEWTFELKTEALAEAAKAKAAFHAGRLEFWKSAEEGVMKDVREKGISVEQSLAGNAYSNVSRGASPQIVIDDTYQRKLNEASEKIREHLGKVREYDGWVQVLSANGGRTYQLNADDYLYFFGK
jgi:uncharacterized membrane-anchored protein YjiN (DUF445 family)